MKNFYHKLIGQDTFSIPKKIESQFNLQFKDAVNTEWQEKKIYFEAIFYFEGVEKIARFNRDGKLLELRSNLAVENIPDEILKIALYFGEIMNSILIVKEGISAYEIIVRNKKLTRILLLIDENNNLQKEEIL